MSVPQPKMSTHVIAPPSEADEMLENQRPGWRRRPVQGISPRTRSPEDLAERMNRYFEERYDKGEHPTFCDLAGAVGFDSVSQLINHARRYKGKHMRNISRALLAVGAGYEEMAQQGSRTAFSMLEKLPQFDSENPAEQVPTQPFHARQQVDVNITGLERANQRGDTLSAQEAYLKLIKHKTYEEALPEVIETEQTDQGDYVVLDLDESPEDE